QKSRIFLPDSIDFIKDFRAYGTIVNIDLPDKDGFSFLLETDSITAAKTVKTQVYLVCNLSGRSYLAKYNNFFPGSLISIIGTYHKGREKRNPGEFDYNTYLHSKNVSGIVTSYKSEDIQILSNKSESFKGFIYSVRTKFDNIISGLHTNETKALLRGLLLADRSEIDFETKTQFINAGVVHILAVSGLHVGFIALIFYAMCGRLNQYFRTIITISGIILFVFITGNPATVVRASVMAIILMISLLSDRTTNIYNSLAIAALLILSIDPSEVFNPGFQLSFSAVLSIAYFYPIISRQISKTGVRNKNLKNVLLFAAVSVSAQIGTMPFTLYYFGKISIVALFANLIVIPLTGVIIGTVIVTFAALPFSLWAASVFASANNLFSHFMFLIVKFAGTLQYSFIDVRNYSLNNALIFYLFLFSGIVILRYLSTFKAKLIVMLLIFLNIGLFSSIDDINLFAEDKLNVYMVDVGQGDSYLIKFPGGKTALIDGGNATQFYDNGERVILPLLHTLGINKIDYGFVSHIDADHYSGFVSLIEKQKLEKIFKPVPVIQSNKDMRFEKYLKSRNIPVEYYSRKQIKINNALIYILNDSSLDRNQSVSSNNRSGILKIVYGNTSFLFTGDLERNGEIYYRKYYADFLNSDVLKLGHHGSKSGTSSEFISSVSPEICLVSCGFKNLFQHPSDKVISRLKSAGAIIYRTDLQGGILLQSDGYVINKIDWKNYY
ncbi:MAG TPA: DNA internalization-related competence protein ComEC/Rec2, partial [Ignavibacteriaceae bacterium]|nr:DNA internalization-related competence protein ComEC/Rec2 [Ignavibacteriaceae bacterium]